MNRWSFIEIQRSTSSVFVRFQKAPLCSSERYKEHCKASSHPSISVSLHNVAGVLESQGKYAEAEKKYGESVAMLYEIFGNASSHPAISASMSGLAVVLGLKGKYVDAEKKYGKSLAMNYEIHGKTSTHPDISAALNGLARVLKLQSKYGEAEKVYQDRCTS